MVGLYSILNMVKVAELYIAGFFVFYYSWICDMSRDVSPMYTVGRIA